MAEKLRDFDKGYHAGMVKSAQIADKVAGRAAQYIAIKIREELAERKVGLK